MNPLEFKEMFREEAREILDNLEEKLMEWEKDPKSTEILNELFRLFHTLKGSSAMFGFEVVSFVAHEVENLLEKIRNNEEHPSQHVINDVLNKRDKIASLIE